MNNSANPSAQKLQLLARKWGATAVPFSQLSDQSWLETPQNRRALELLDQSAALRSVMLLAGPNGVGKSVLLHRWAGALDTRLFHPVSLTHATLTGSSVLAALTIKLDKPPASRRERNLALIEEALGELANQRLVLILDEAQNYSHGALEEIRLLLGLNLPLQPLFALILIGDEYLLASLRLRHHRALYSRIGCSHTLGAWNAEQVDHYLQSSLAAVGIDRPVLEPAAAQLLATASGGVARSLCLLARASWISAALEGSSKICAEHVQEALHQVPCAPGMHTAAAVQPSDS